jgi:hypothetical protein
MKIGREERSARNQTMSVISPRRPDRLRMALRSFALRVGRGGWGEDPPNWAAPDVVSGQ